MPHTYLGKYDGWTNKTYDNEWPRGMLGQVRSYMSTPSVKLIDMT